MTLRSLGVGIVVGMCTSSIAHAQSVGLSYSSMTVGEMCADNARRLVSIKGKTFAIRLKVLDPSLRQSARSDEEIVSRFLAGNRCLTYSIPVDRCPDVQKEVNETVGDTLGARLKVIFPMPTEGMRAQYAEMYLRTFCPDLRGPAVQPIVDSSIPIELFVEVPPASEGFVPPAMVGMGAIVKELTAELLKSRRRASTIIQARNKDAADVVVSVTSRDASGNHRIVRGRVVVRENSFEFEASSDDGDYATAADTLATQIVEWITENHTRIVESRPKP